MPKFFEERGGHIWTNINSVRDLRDLEDISDTTHAFQHAKLFDFLTEAT
jgi:hypothetical protein